MEPTAQQLLGAIRSSPADDAPRLAYAAWLEHQGDPRGEFIRAQCQLARLAPDEAGYGDLRGRERALLAAHGAAWSGWPDLARGWAAWVDGRDSALLGLRSGPPWHDELALRFERGFVAEATINAGAFARYAPAIAQLDAERLHATVWNDVAYSDWADDQIARMAEQNAYDQHALADMTALAHSAYADRITDLSLSSAVGGYAEHLGALLDLLVYAPFVRLDRLAIDFGWLRSAHVAALANWPGLARLRALVLRKASLSAALVRQLFEPGGGGALESLDLSSNEAGPDIAAALAGCPQLSSLAFLYLGTSRLGAQGMRALAGAPFWPRIRALDVSGEWQMAELGWPERTIPSLGVAGFDTLLNELPRAQLADLALRYSALDDDMLIALAAAPSAANLRRLDLFGNPIGDRGAQALAESPFLAQLAYLRIYSPLLGPDGKQELRRRFGARVVFGS